MKTLERSKIIEDLIGFGTIEVCSIGHHFALAISDGEYLDHYKTVNNINNILKDHGVYDVYPNLQVMKNEHDFLILTLNK